MFVVSLISYMASARLAFDFIDYLHPGTGILTRPPHTQSDDIDDEIDIFGDDEAVYGDAQFTEGDIVTVSRPASSEDNNLVGEEERTLRELVAEGKVIRRRKEEEDPKVSGKLESLDEGEEDRLDLAILAARQRQDTTLLISLLENKLDFLVRLLHPCDSRE